MRRVFRWLVGLLSALAVWKLLSRRRGEPAAPPAEETDPAETHQDAEPEPPAEEASAETIEERRARVHEKAQETIDSMRDDEA
jgi:hypothetical protein